MRKITTTISVIGSKIATAAQALALSRFAGGGSNTSTRRSTIA